MLAVILFESTGLSSGARPNFALQPFLRPGAPSLRAIQFAVTKLFGTGSQVPLLLVIDVI
jgi:hypothetical protein